MFEAILFRGLRIFYKNSFPPKKMPKTFRSNFVKDVEEESIFKTSEKD